MQRRDPRRGRLGGDRGTARSLGVLEQPGGAQGSPPGWLVVGTCSATAAGDLRLLEEGQEQGGEVAAGGGPQPRQAAEPPLQPCSICVC